MSEPSRRGVGFGIALVCWALAFLAPIDRPAWAQSSAGLARIVMGPPGYDHGRCLRELFADPDGWKETRSLIDTMVFGDLKLNENFKNDEELRGYLAQIKSWNIKLELEVGAVKEWAGTGEKTFNADRKFWDRFQRLGGTIHSIAMDEPLVCTREHLHQSDDFAAEETAKFITLVRKNYPEVLIGDIETYPSISIEDNCKWIESLEKKLAERGVRGLDFYRLDVNWVRFPLYGDGSWAQVKKLEHFCRQRKLPFSLTYWASNFPPLKNRKLADDSTWQSAIMQQGCEYALVDGRPDQIVIQSWDEAPAHAAPETADFTFTHATRDFIHKFVKRTP